MNFNLSQALTVYGKRPQLNRDNTQLYLLVEVGVDLFFLDKMCQMPGYPPPSPHFLLPLEELVVCEGFKSLCLSLSESVPIPHQDY